MLETLGDPAPVIAELRRVTKRGGVVGAASVEYDGIIIAGEPTAGPRRFYDIRQQLWRAARIAEPNTGQRLRVGRRDRHYRTGVWQDLLLS